MPSLCSSVPIRTDVRVTRENMHSPSTAEGGVIVEKTRSPDAAVACCTGETLSNHLHRPDILPSNTTCLSHSCRRRHTGGVAHDALAPNFLRGRFAARTFERTDEHKVNMATVGMDKFKLSCCSIVDTSKEGKKQRSPKWWLPKCEPLSKAASPDMKSVDDRESCSGCRSSLRNCVQDVHAFSDKAENRKTLSRGFQKPAG